MKRLTTTNVTIAIAILMFATYIGFALFFSAAGFKPVLATYAACATSIFICAFKIRRRNDGLGNMGASVLFSVSFILVILVIADYFLPKPVQPFKDGNMVATGIVMLFVIGTGLGAAALRSSGTQSGKNASVVYRLANIGACCVFFVWLNNVVYDGCYPNSPIGCACDRSQVTSDEYIPDVPNGPAIQSEIATHESGVSETIFIPKGGSLCGTLGMSVEEAKTFAAKFGYKSFSKNGKFVVVIQPGDQFHKVTRDGVTEWEPLNYGQFFPARKAHA